MTARDACKAGASWGASIARANHAGDAQTSRVYAARSFEEAADRIPPELRGDFWTGHDAAYDAEWARLEGEQG